MALIDDIENDVQSVIDQPWNLRTGRVVPSSEDVALAGGSVELEATMLYADLASSSKIAKELDRRVAAKILKAFLATTSRLVKARDGTVVSFDGDRILGVFVGDSKNSNAAKCALNINYAVGQVIRPKFVAKYDTVRDASFKIEHGCGIDTGTVLTVRAGARGDNDLIWIGRAPNLAAKLSDIRDAPYFTFITGSVYNRLQESSKIGSDKKDMWESRVWTFLDEKISVYRSSYHWKP